MTGSYFFPEKMRRFPGRRASPQKEINQSCSINPKAKKETIKHTRKINHILQHAVSQDESFAWREPRVLWQGLLFTSKRPPTILCKSWGSGRVWSGLNRTYGFIYGSKSASKTSRLKTARALGAVHTTASHFSFHISKWDTIPGFPIYPPKPVETPQLTQTTREGLPEFGLRLNVETAVRSGGFLPVEGPNVPRKTNKIYRSLTFPKTIWHPFRSMSRGSRLLPCKKPKTTGGCDVFRLPMWVWLFYQISKMHFCLFSVDFSLKPQNRVPSLNRCFRLFCSCHDQR